LQSRADECVGATNPMSGKRACRGHIACFNAFPIADPKGGT